MSRDKLRCVLTTIFAATAACGGATSVASAQVRIEEIGLRAGYSQSSMYVTRAPCNRFEDVCVVRLEPAAGRDGVSASAFVHARIWRVLGAQAEAVYSQKGFEISQPMIYANYVEFPLMVRVNPFGASSLASPYAYVGLSPSWFIVVRSPLQAARMCGRTADRMRLTRVRSASRSDSCVAPACDSPCALSLSRSTTALLRA